MKNKKGFTITELLVSFVLLTIVIIYLLKATINIITRENELLMLQEYNVFESTLLNKFYEDIEGLTDISVDTTNPNEINFKVGENDSVYRNISFSEEGIYYDNVLYELPNSVKLNSENYYTKGQNSYEEGNYIKNYTIITIPLTLNKKEKNIYIIVQNADEKPVVKSKKIDENSVTITYSKFSASENSIKSVVCKYGSDKENLTETGTYNNDYTCSFPLTAEYSQVCVTNSNDLTKCSDIKQMAVYLIKDGETLVEFSNKNSSDEETCTVTKNTSTKSIDMEISSATSGRVGIYTVNKIDLSKYSYIYTDLSYSVTVNSSSSTNPTFALIFMRNSDVYSINNDEILHLTLYGKTGITSDSFSIGRKTYTIDVSDKTEPGVYEIRRNVSRAQISSKVYNVYLQLSE